MLTHHICRHYKQRLGGERSSSEEAERQTGSEEKNKKKVAKMTFWQENYSFIKEVYDTRFDTQSLVMKTADFICYLQVLQDGGVDGQCGDGHCKGVRKQGVYLSRV